MDLHIHTKEDRADRTVVRGLDESNQMKNIKGRGHFFETLSVGSVSGTDHFPFSGRNAFRQVYAGKKRLRWHRHINAFFGLKTVVNQKA